VERDPHTLDYRVRVPAQTCRHHLCSTRYLLLMTLSLSAVGHAQTSQTYYFGEG
jgi:hypothetical protein